MASAVARTPAVTRPRGWTITLSHDLYDQDRLEESLENWKGYAYFGFEVSDTGYKHWQGVLWDKDRPVFNTVQGKFPGAHLEVMQGTFAQALAYCQKDKAKSTFVEVEHNPTLKPAGQGKRNDLLDMYRAMESGEDIHSLLLGGHIRNFQGLRAAQCLRSLLRPPRRPDVRAAWIYGPTGTGKTRTALSWLAYDDHPVAIRTGGEKYTTYDSEQRLLWDEFESSADATAALLSIASEAPALVRVFGGHAPCLIRMIVVTSHSHPSTYFADRWPEIRRRLNAGIYHLTELGGVLPNAPLQSPSPPPSPPPSPALQAFSPTSSNL